MGSYFVGDRAAVTALLRAARLLREAGQRPVEDGYLVFTTNEEIGGVGGCYATAGLPGTLTLAWRSGLPSRSTRPASPAVRSSATTTPCVSTTRTSPSG